jgi:NAD(P)-dependent dehydrogenase (short-subunit alcohol dehydrogenase family)
MSDENNSMQAPMRLPNKVALVTGGGSGIGRAAALAFAREGATVVVAGRRLAELTETANMIEAAGGRASAHVVDVSSDASVRALIDACCERHGRLDIAFNNAGTEGKFADITDLTEADFDHVVGTNLKGVWLSMKYQIKAMSAFGNGGSIVNTSSWLARKAVAGSSAYSASKGGLEAMTWAVAQEAGPKGIRVNNVLPGVIDTPMYRRLGTEEALSNFAAATPLRRAGAPTDVGDVAVWLSSAEATFVTGQSISVDGGFSLVSM